MVVVQLPMSGKIFQKIMGFEKKVEGVKKQEEVKAKEKKA